MNTKLIVYFMFAAIGLHFLMACSQNTSHKTNLNNSAVSVLKEDSLAKLAFTDSLHSKKAGISPPKHVVLPTSTASKPTKPANTTTADPAKTAAKAPDTLPVLSTNSATAQNTATLPPQAQEPPTPMRPFTPLPPTNAEQLDAFFAAANQFLQRYVNTLGKVNYTKIKADKTELNALVRKIAFANLQGTTNNQQAAFYLNAYNILVIKLVIDYNIPKSPLEVQGFFGQILLDVAQKKLTLDQLQKNTLFAIKPDARLHFALVCAATDCPPLLNAAYMPHTLNEQLTQQTQKALNTPKFVQPDEQAGRVLVSKIFEWYEKDFTAASSDKSVIGFINQYRNKPIPTHFTLQYKEYNWQLNNQ